MPGSWLALVRGFANLQVHDKKLNFSPVRPSHWTKYAFKVNFQGRKLGVEVTDEVRITLFAGEPLAIQVYDTPYTLSPSQSLCVPGK